MLLCEGVPPTLRTQEGRFAKAPAFFCLVISKTKGGPIIDPPLRCFSVVPSGASEKPEDQADHHRDKEDEEQNLRNRGRGTGNAAKAEHPGDDCNYEEGQCPSKHGGYSRLVEFAMKTPKPARQFLPHGFFPREKPEIGVFQFMI